MSEYTVVSLVPQLLNIHGDAQNAQVLAARAHWAGHDARVVEIHSESEAEGVRPDAITIGSGFDSDAEELLHMLESLATHIRTWVAQGIPLLAVGLGWELLSRGTDLGTGAPLTGIGVFSGHFVISERRVGPMKVRSEWGTLTGYEYHYRDYILGDDERALGDIEVGVGNTSGVTVTRTEGAIRGTAYGTTMRGPILARNPQLADLLLGDYAKLQNSDDAPNGHTSPRDVADKYAALTNRRVLGD